MTPRGVRRRRLRCAALLCTLLAAAGVAPAQTNATSTLAAPADPADNSALYEEIAALTETLMLVRRGYVEELPFAQIVDGAIHGLLERLDPHNAYLPPADAEHFKEETTGHFGGIGASVVMHAGLPVIVVPQAGAPASQAGLQSGDTLLEIDGRSTANQDLHTITTWLRGVPGSAVRLSVKRADQAPFSVELRREALKLATVKGVNILRGRVGYLRLTQFSETTAADFNAALDTLLTNDLAGLVLDLRDNSGGLLAQAIDVASRFLPARSVVVKVRARPELESDAALRTTSALPPVKLPLVLLINANSASAAEVVAGALQDHHRAVVVGERSYGKASVQRVIPLGTRPGSAIKLTTAYYLTPNGRQIHGHGIVPDIDSPLAADHWRQVQLQRLVRDANASLPVTQTAAEAEIVDRPLERAIDILIGAALLQGKDPAP